MTIHIPGWAYRALHRTKPLAFLHAIPGLTLRIKE